MTIDASKTGPEKLAEMNDALITDNQYLRGRVAQLTSQINEVVLTIPDTRYMDPPDGGDVPLGEQVRRMALDLGAKQAEIDRLMIEHCPDEVAEACAKVCDTQYERARTSAGAARANSCALNIRSGEWRKHL